MYIIWTQHNAYSYLQFLFWFCGAIENAARRGLQTTSKTIRVLGRRRIASLEVKYLYLIVLYLIDEVLDVFLTFQKYSYYEAFKVLLNNGSKSGGVLPRNLEHQNTRPVCMHWSQPPGGHQTEYMLYE